MRLLDIDAEKRRVVPRVISDVLNINIIEEHFRGLGLQFSRIEWNLALDLGMELVTH
jgi:hypothetical protein